MKNEDNYINKNELDLSSKNIKKIYKSV